MIEAVKTLLGKYGGFEGRATRTELLIAKLVFTPVLTALLWFRFYVSELTLWEQGGIFWIADTLIWAAQWAIILAVGYLSLSYSVRRFHDINLSGGNYVALALGCMIPLARYLSLASILIFYVLPPSEGANDYGPNPRSKCPQPPDDLQSLPAAER